MATLPGEILSTAMAMAIAVLADDFDTAKVLADLLSQDTQGGGTQVLPVQRITVSRDRLRFIVYVDPELGAEVNLNVEELEREIDRWWRGEVTVLGVVGVVKVEVYELPAREDKVVGIPKTQYEGLIRDTI